VKLQKSGPSDVMCLVCGKTSVISTEGVKQLPNNFFINRIIDEMTLKEKVAGEKEICCDVCIRDDPAVVMCFDCGVFLCTHCHESHKYGREYQGHNISELKELGGEMKDFSLPRPKVKLLLCQEHEMELNFYCDTCEQLVCHYCTMTDHNTHKHNSVKKMASKHRLELDKIIEPVEKMINELSKACQKFTATQDKIQMQATEVNQQIDNYYEQLQRQLQQQREELKKKLHELSTQQNKAVSLQLEQMEHAQSQLESVRELNNAIKNGSDQEVLFMKKQVTEDVKRLTACCKIFETEPVEVAAIQFIPVEMEKHRNCFPQLANVFHSNASLNFKAENIPPVAYVNKIVNFTIINANYESHDHLCSEGGNKVIVQAQSSGTRDVIPVTIKNNKNGSYSASFIPYQAGETKLSVIINGRHIQGSPYSVLVHGDYLALAIPSKVVNDGGRMGKPRGITFSKDGMWAVSDHTNHCVYIFDSQDQLVKKVGSKGKGNGQFDFPAGLAFDVDNHLYVVCRYNHRVQKFSINGEYLLQFGSHGAGIGQLNCPLGIAVHNNRVYVADQLNHRISVFQCDGNFCHAVGYPDQLNKPFDVAVNNNNQLLIVNYTGNCICILTLDGNYVGKIGSSGSSRGQLRTPSSLAIDMHGFIFVTEYDNNRISIFDKDGVFIHCFGSKGSTNGKFSAPCGIALSPNGSIYISDYENNRIQIFSDY